MTPHFVTWVKILLADNGKEISKYRSVISGDAANNKHEVKRDNEFDDESLQVGSRRKCPHKVVVFAAEQQPQRAVCQRRSGNLDCYISRYLHTIIYVPKHIVWLQIN